MSKFILKILVLCFFNILLFSKVFALDNGVYTGVYKIFYAHPDSDSRKGDKGVFEFTIKDNKVIKLFEYDDPNWKLYDGLLHLDHFLQRHKFFLMYHSPINILDLVYMKFPNNPLQNAS